MTIKEWFETKRETRRELKEIEEESFKKEKIKVTAKKKKESIKKAKEKGKEKARRTGLPGPRVSPETRKKGIKAIKTVGKKLSDVSIRAAERQAAESKKAKKSTKKRKVTDDFEEYNKRMEKLFG